MATYFIPSDIAGGTILVNEGDVFIVESTAANNITFQSASGSPTNFSVEFNESNANVIDVIVQPNLTPTITIADGVSLGNTTIDAKNADAANVTIGDNVSLKKYVGTDAGADTVTIGDNFTTTNDFKTGAGDDLVYVGQNFSGPKIDTGSGDDTVYAKDGSATIQNAEAVITPDGTVSGTAGADLIDGSYEDVDGDAIDGWDGDDDLIHGLGGDDTILAGAGNDVIDGGAGDDSLTGGDGDDVFIVSSGNDTISDFNFGNTGALGDGDSTNNDFIDLSGYYDSLNELRADQADDGILNQSNTLDDKGNAVDYSDNTQFGTNSITMQGASASSFSNDNTGVVCFTSGTAIRTPHGDVLIDDLNIGDWVSTMDNGPQRILWIGRREIGRDALNSNPKLRPVLIRKGILSAERDLLVSRQHALLVNCDQLARAADLIDVNGLPVRIANGKKQVIYIHLMFDAHQIIFAENVAAESFYPGPMAIKMLDTAAREEMMLIFPEFAGATSRNCYTRIYGQTARIIAKRQAVMEPDAVSGLRHTAPQASIAIAQGGRLPRTFSNRCP